MQAKIITPTSTQSEVIAANLKSRKGHVKHYPVMKKKPLFSAKSLQKYPIGTVFFNAYRDTFIVREALSRKKATKVLREFKPVAFRRAATLASALATYNKH